MLSTLMKFKHQSPATSQLPGFGVILFLACWQLALQMSAKEGTRYKRAPTTCRTSVRAEGH